VTSMPKYGYESGVVSIGCAPRPARDKAGDAPVFVPADAANRLRTSAHFASRVARDRAAILSHSTSNWTVISLGIVTEAGA
jgi:hypothetical protein